MPQVVRERSHSEYVQHPSKDGDSSYYSVSLPHNSPPNTAPDKLSLSLTTLPPELVQLITSFLPASSAVAFALCNHPINSALGTQQWEALGTWRSCGCRKRYKISPLMEAMSTAPPQDTLSEFLSLLEQDLPTHIFCRRCAILHVHIFQSSSDAERQRVCAHPDLCAMSLTALSAQRWFSLLQ
jgi:hypothetical protein